MDKNICFNKNTFIIGIFIIIIIIFILSYYINFNFDNNCNANIYNLINKKILNIKDKIIKNKINNNYNKQEQENNEQGQENNEQEQNYNKQEQNYNKQEQNYNKQEQEQDYNVKQNYNKQEQNYNKQEQNYNKQEQNYNVYEQEQDYNKYEQDYNEYEQEQDYNVKQNYNKQKQDYNVKQNYNKQEQREENKNEKIYGYRNNINISDNTIEEKHFNYRNNINDRINERDDLIKYKLDNTVEQRDLNVLLNPIYPPLGRVERPTFDNLLKMKIGESTRGSEDTFRLIGYLVNTNKNDIDMGNNVWKLFGRQTYRGSSIGEFYVSPVNEHKTDMKIFLKNEMMPKEKIRDLYALPNIVYLDSPFFSKNPYTLNELPKSDFNSNYL